MKDNIGLTHIYKNGIKIKSKKNASVLVGRLDDINNSDVILEFQRAGLPLKLLQTPAALHKVLRNKVKVTGICLSKESAYQLYYCLFYYFKNIDTNEFNKEE